MAKQWRNENFYMRQSVSLLLDSAIQDMRQVKFASQGISKPNNFISLLNLAENDIL